MEPPPYPQQLTADPELNGPISGIYSIRYFSKALAGYIRPAAAATLQRPHISALGQMPHRIPADRPTTSGDGGNSTSSEPHRRPPRQKRRHQLGSGRTAPDDRSPSSTEIAP